ncbi:unnamed protein product (macronuclear) [Paramecium tetraurelia]|uniref:Uncharacterized protein n=1 Tax=Paramecium tetraurelia TaxID=5888 RepID=A0BQ71_PARTE|nr:uncharacterized protein GSPATT00005439001 [Paramecium tetraurelia]CAK60688.1 unnamed protein product [Paramecium tetraurelia]|eukprot:XP_001428086.1 hypothetical protein (macronuclear) [Paramecium tetraurelia strain d4-2]
MFIYLQLIFTLTRALIVKNDVTSFYQDMIKKQISFLCESGRLTFDNGFYTYQIFLKENHTDYTNFTDADQLWIMLTNNGCSSIMHAYDKYGPFVYQNRQLDLHPYSYNKFINLLYIDQPFGVGFSEGIGEKNDNAIKILQFIEEFLVNKGIPNMKIMLYGKEYVSSLFSKIIENSIGYNLNIEGIILENAWVSPIHQIGYYGSFLYQLGLIDDQRRDEIYYNTTQIQVQLLNQNFTNLTQLKTLVNQSQSELKLIENDGNNNLEDITQFINDHSFQLFEINKDDYSFCNDTQHEKAQQQLLNSTLFEIEMILNKQKMVIVLVKQIQFTVTTPGIVTWVNQLRWQHITKWRISDKKFIREENYDKVQNMTKNKTVGYIKQFDKLKYIVAYDELFKLLNQIIIDN